MLKMEIPVPCWRADVAKGPQEKTPWGSVAPVSQAFSHISQKRFSGIISLF